MADAIKKFLAKVSAPERLLLIDLIQKILLDQVHGLQIKKLVGQDDIFRLRKGDFRIVYKRKKLDCVIISIERRSEKTYRDF